MSLAQTKNLNPDMIQTYDLPYTMWALYPLSYEETMESEAIS